jgi:hypothetical protein
MYNKYLKYKFKYMNLVNQAGGSATTNKLIASINDISRKNKLSKLYYFSYFSALGTRNNKTIQHDYGGGYDDITPETNQQYPFFMTHFTDYHKIIILLDLDFEKELEIKKNVPGLDEKKIDIDDISIKLLSNYNHDIYVITYKVPDDYTESQLDLDVLYMHYAEVVLYSNNDRIIVHSFGPQLKIDQNYNILLEAGMSDTYSREQIKKKIVMNFSPYNNYKNGPCFCNEQRLPINNTLFNVDPDKFFYQYKYRKLTENVRYLTSNGLNSEEHNQILLYNIYFIIDIFNQTIRKYPDIKITKLNYIYNTHDFTELKRLIHIDLSDNIDKILTNDDIQKIYDLKYESAALSYFENDQNLNKIITLASKSYLENFKFLLLEFFENYDYFVPTDPKRYINSLSKLKTNIKDYFINNKGLILY